MQLLSLLIVGGCTFLASAANYALNVVSAHNLAGDQFGGFGAILGVIAILSTIGLAAQAIIARDQFRIDDLHSRPEFGGRIARQLLVSSTLICLILVWPVSVWLNLNLLTTFVFLAAVPISLIPAFAIGKLQGSRSFVRLSAVVLVVGASRAAFGIGFVLLNSTISSLAIGLFLGTLFGAGISLWLGSTDLFRNSIQQLGAIKSYLIVLQALALMFALSNIDVVLARVLLTPTQSGVYAVGSLMAKIAFFLPSPILIVLYPSMANHSSRRAVYLATLGTLATGFLLLLFTRMEPNVAAGLLAGSDLSNVAGILWLFVISGTCLAIVQVALYARLANQDSGVVKLMWVGLALLITLIFATGSSGPTSIVICVIVVSGILAVVGLLMDRSLRIRHEIPIEIAE